MHFLRTLLQTPVTHPSDSATEARLVALETHVKALYDHASQQSRELQQLRQDEARRAAEHATMVDQLSRLYKRVSARIARTEEVEQSNGLTTGDLRRRLGR